MYFERVCRLGESVPGKMKEKEKRHYTAYKVRVM